MPLLTDEEVEQEALRYGLIDTAARGAAKAAIQSGEKAQEEDGSIKKSAEETESRETIKEV